MLFRGLKKANSDSEGKKGKVVPHITDNPLDFERSDYEVEQYALDCGEANTKDLDDIERKTLNLINKAKKGK